MDTILNIIIYVVITILIFYIYVSVFVIFYCIYIGRDLDHEPIFWIKTFSFSFFFFGCIIGLTAFFAAWFERALFFIPESWGFLNENGDWQSRKEYLSYTLAFWTTILLLIKSEKVFSKKEKK